MFIWIRNEEFDIRTMFDEIISLLLCFTACYAVEQMLMTINLPILVIFIISMLIDMGIFHFGFNLCKKIISKIRNFIEYRMI